MNAPIADQIKAQAAKSLLERLGEKTKLVKLFRHNAAMKHGVPMDEDANINIDTTSVQQQQESNTTTTQEKTGVVQPIVIDNQKTDGGGDKTKGILQGLGAAAAIAAAIWGGTKLAGGDPAPAPQNTTTVEQPYWQESPFQYLEDLGEHIP